MIEGANDQRPLASHPLGERPTMFAFDANGSRVLEVAPRPIWRELDDALLIGQHWQADGRQKDE
jgi:hypothetical protein